MVSNNMMERRMSDDSNLVGSVLHDLTFNIPVKTEMTVTIHVNGTTTEYCLPTVPYPQSDALSGLVAAVIALEKRVCELDIVLSELKGEK